MGPALVNDLLFWSQCWQFACFIHQSAMSLYHWKVKFVTYNKYHFEIKWLHLHWFIGIVKLLTELTQCWHIFHGMKADFVEISPPKILRIFCWNLHDYFSWYIYKLHPQKFYLGSHSSISDIGPVSQDPDNPSYQCRNAQAKEIYPLNSLRLLECWTERKWKFLEILVFLSQKWEKIIKFQLLSTNLAYFLFNLHRMNEFFRDIIFSQRIFESQVEHVCFGNIFFALVKNWPWTFIGSTRTKPKI